ncbi:MAG: hypothetical protein QOF27_2280 [Gaiellaceae bacterium]|jgi:hypothetical protein|nr:hypothetical protein [Gaiellaceae bacterium]
MAADYAGSALRPRCQARPAAGLRWARDDVACANAASAVVTYRGAEMPVCRIHERMYARWRVDAEARAASVWGWPGT